LSSSERRRSTATPLQLESGNEEEGLERSRSEEEWWFISRKTDEPISAVKITLKERYMLKSRAQNDTYNHESERLEMNEVPSVPYPSGFLTVCVFKGVGRENSFLSLYYSEKEPIAIVVFAVWLHRRCQPSTQRAVNQVHSSASPLNPHFLLRFQAVRQVPFFRALCLFLLRRGGNSRRLRQVEKFRDAVH